MILVTGGTGFLGSYLLHYLISKGKNVRAIRREHSDISLVSDIYSQIEWVNADILDIYSLSEAMVGVDQVYHSAAIVSYQKQDRQKMMQVNVDGTANVVNACLDKNVKKLLHVSSIASLGRKKKIQEIDERSEWEGSKYHNHYGISKFRSEREVWRGIAEGLQAVIVNPSVILGAGRDKDPSFRIFRKVNDGLKIYTEGITGYVDVRDVVKIMVELMDSDISGERFVINASNLRLKHMLDLVAEALDKKPPAFKIPTKVVKLFAPLEELRAQIFNDEAIATPDLVKSIGNEYYYSSEKVKETLNYHFIPIEKTIQETAAVMKNSASPQVLSF